MAVSSQSHNLAVENSRERSPDRSCVGRAGQRALEERKVPTISGNPIPISLSPI